MNSTRLDLRRAGLAAVLVLAAGCGQDLVTPDPVPVDRAALDADAGTWRMIVLTSADQVPVPAPADADSAAYRAELAQVAGAQRALTDAQRERIEYWGSGGVSRWNEILRELVARFNLPPAPRADGTYPVPDAANPFSDPQFPFANPPYAARAYSYVSVGAYEALKSAWHYKYLYRRPAPSRVDSAITAIVPAGELPAYPSEDAVLSGVMEVMLRALFPAAVEEIDAKAAEQRATAMWSGRAAPSDIAAGQALGRAVAAAMMARAATDGMRTAGGSPAVWQQLADRAAARGEIP
jgi:hypothetical protein